MLKKYGHTLPIVIVLPVFIYMMYQAISMTSQQIGIGDDITNRSYYFTSVEISPEIKALANKLQTVQACLDYVTNIPYKIHNFRARTPLSTIKKNHGDCDDKSNLLSALLSALGYENYIVLVPRHAFVIVNLKRSLTNKKALHFNDKSYYILESTAKNSPIGYRFKYRTNQIEAIINPLKKDLLQTGSISYY